MHYAREIFVYILTMDGFVVDFELKMLYNYKY